jgi:ribose 5-phosphate isomerase B
MKIYLATDHAGFNSKEAVRVWLSGEGYVVEDCGAYTLEPLDDYPKYMHVVGRKLAEDVHAGRNARAIIFGASGQGEAMVANRYPGVRAAVWYGGNVEVLAATRAHNNANCLSIGAHYMSADEAVRAVSAWLATPFSLDERHVRRIEQIEHTI